MERYIDARKLEETFAHDVWRDKEQKVYVNDVFRAIYNAPTADVVEVVRCEKCKHWDAENVKRYTYSNDDDRLVDFAECFRWSNWSVCRLLRYNDFCSCGEKR